MTWQSVLCYAGLLVGFAVVCEVAAGVGSWLRRSVEKARTRRRWRKGGAS